MPKTPRGDRLRIGPEAVPFLPGFDLIPSCSQHAYMLPSVDLRRDIVLATEVFGEARGIFAAIM